MLKRLMYLSAALSILGVTGFGATTLYAAQRVLPMECPENNWCVGFTPDQRCNECCGLPSGGLCLMYGGSPDGPQDCICYGK